MTRQQNMDYARAERIAENNAKTFDARDISTKYTLSLGVDGFRRVFRSDSFDETKRELIRRMLELADRWQNTMPETADQIALDAEDVNLWSEYGGDIQSVAVASHTWSIIRAPFYHLKQAQIDRFRDWFASHADRRGIKGTLEQTISNIENALNDHTTLRDHVSEVHWFGYYFGVTVGGLFYGIEPDGHIHT